MSITPERKQELIKEYGLQEGDTGSPEVQIAIITERVKNLTEHLKEHKKRCALASWPADAGCTASLAIGLRATQGRRALSQPHCSP